MENIGANKTLGDLSWEELLEATSTETLHAERLRDQASFAGKVGGKVQGDINAKNGHMDSIRKVGAPLGGKIAGVIQGSKKYVCPHCEDEGKSNAWKQKHFDNCIGKVYQYDKVTKELVGIYSSTKQAIEKNDDSWNRQLINNVIIGKKKSAYGFIWERKR